MSEEVTSECPAFKKGWSPEVQECIACKENFAEEYSVCKKECTPVDANLVTKPVTAAANSATVATDLVAVKSENVETASVIKSPFKGFRDGSRADVLSKYLIEVGLTTFEEAAVHLAQVADIGKDKALVNVKDYAREWSRGKCNGKDVELPFIVVIDAGGIACENKGEL